MAADGRRFRKAFPILQVADVQRSLGFYRELLGFEVKYAFPADGEPAFVSLAVEGGKLGLGTADGPVETASTSIWLYTDDVDDAVASWALPVSGWWQSRPIRSGESVCAGRRPGRLRRPHRRSDHGELVTRNE